MREYALATDYLVRKLKTSSNPRFAENIDIHSPLPQDLTNGNNYAGICL
jgi:hypothetical protein